MGEAVITRRIEIDMGHRIPNHKSKCKNLHGHRYVFEVGVRGLVKSMKNESDEGMVIDFGDVKEIMMEKIHDPLDHGFMMFEGDPFRETFESLNDQKIIFVPFVPTAEHVAKYAFDEIQPELEQRGLSLDFVKVWETPNSSAVYTG